MGAFSLLGVNIALKYRESVEAVVPEMACD